MAVVAQRLPGPFEKMYFSDEMIMKYQPLATALELLQETEGKDEEVIRDYKVHWKTFESFDWCSNWDGKRYDIVFYGVSGYTGYLMMQYLKRVSLKRNPEQFTFAIAGRTLSKVHELRNREFEGTEWEDTPILQMSYDDIYSIIDLVKSARVIVNIAGPYMLTQGELMIDACTHMGVHYCDISGEVPWSRRIMELHEKAKDKGVHIVPSAASAGGYPDLGVYLCAKKIREQYGDELRKAICYNSGGGEAAGSSGGTLKTRAAMASSDDAREMMADVFSMGGFIPDRDRWGIKKVDVQMGTGKVTPKLRDEDRDANMSKVTYDERLDIWRGPFVYSYFDTRVVRRSNKLFADLGNWCYGANLNFLEYAMIPPEAMFGAQAPKEVQPPEAKKGGGGVGVEAEKAALEARGKYYKEGEGPALEDLDDAWIGYFIWVMSEKGHETRCNFIGRDGYFETARVAVETAMCLAFDYEKLPFRGGVLTPTVSSGDRLAQRMIASGVKFQMGGWFPVAEHSPPFSR